VTHWVEGRPRKRDNAPKEFWELVWAVGGGGQLMGELIKRVKSREFASRSENSPNLDGDDQDIGTTEYPETTSVPEGSGISARGEGTEKLSNDVWGGDGQRYETVRTPGNGGRPQALTLKT